MWSFQMLDNEVGQRAHPDDYSRSFGLSQFHESDTDLQRVPQEAHSKSFCSSQVLQDGWDSEKDLLELFSTGCPAGEVRSTYWDFERLEVEELPTDSMPCWGSGGFPNCQNCVHRESSNYCWIGQGGWDVSIPSKPPHQKKSTCCVAGKAFEAWRSHRKLHPMCSTCSLATWVLQERYSSCSCYQHSCQHLWIFHAAERSTCCCWDQFQQGHRGPEKIPFQPPPGHCCSGQSSSDHWDSERQFFEVFSTGCPARKVASSYWDFERLEVEELPTDSMPSSSPRVFPNCQNCVHRESSNYCWIGQGDWDVSIPSKLQAKMKSTCCVAGKALEASQSHRKLHPTCATCSLAAWGLLGSNRESNPSQHL